MEPIATMLVSFGARLNVALVQFLLCSALDEDEENTRGTANLFDSMQTLLRQPSNR
jgi:hypothetical protein